MRASRPLDVQGVDFLVAEVAGENGRAVGRDVDLSRPGIHHTMEIFQAGDDFHPLVGESDALDLWFRASGREIEILAVRRWHPVHDVADVFRAEVGQLLSLQIEGHEVRLLGTRAYERVLVNPESADAIGRKIRFLSCTYIG